MKTIDWKAEAIAYTEKRWQRLRSPYALRLAKRIVEHYLDEIKEK